MQPGYEFKMAIIDLDPIVYRAGFSIEKMDKETEILHVEPLSHALYNVNHMIQECLKASGTDMYQGFLTSSDQSNFRFTLFKDYKSNRKGARKPYWYTEIREFLVTYKGAVMIYGQEADDACSIAHCKENRSKFHPDIVNSIVWSFDKDFNNIPGWHGNYVTKEIYYVEEIQALRNFYLQILTGDISDGIPRIKKGWRQKEAEDQIETATDEAQLRRIVRHHIKGIIESKDHSQEDIEEQAQTILIDRGRLVWLRREEDELWA